MVWLVGFGPLVWTSIACGGRCVPIETYGSPEDSRSLPTSPCPTESQSISIAPGTDPRLLRAEFWLDRLPPGQADQLILDSTKIELLNKKTTTVKDAFRDILLFDELNTIPEIDASAAKDRDINERLAWIHHQLETGNYTESVEGSIKRATQRIHESRYAPSFHFLIQETKLACLPMHEGLFTQPIDSEFDRNNCGSLHPGQLIHVLYRHPSETWRYVDAGHSVGWIADAPLSEKKSVDELEPIRNKAQVFITQDRTSVKFQVPNHANEASIHLRIGSSFPLSSQQDDSYTIEILGEHGLQTATIPRHAASLGPLPFTRKNLWTLAFAQLNDPYGWGGNRGHRDCSSYLLDLMATFGIQLARHSSVQAKLGSQSIDVQSLGEAEKISTILRASESGVLLLYMPGHILLYLGEVRPKDSMNIQASNMYGISAISEIVQPCTDKQDTTLRLDRTTVTSLDVGRGSQRRSFIERITKISYYGTKEIEAENQRVGINR